MPPLEIARGLVSHARAVQATATAEENWKRMEGTPVAGAAWEAWWVWWLVERATDTRRSEKERREALRDLILRTSWRAVLTGQLPPPIPEE